MAYGKTIPHHFFSNIGKKYHRITILDLKIQSGQLKALYRCDCGALSMCPFYSLSKRCKKCYTEDQKRKTPPLWALNFPEYITWKAMTKRCRNPNDPAFHNYGGRGIKVCKRWLGKKGFAHFIKDMGPRPEPKNKYSIDRINNNGNYSPKNCKWATKTEQLFNKRAYLPTYDKQCVVCKKNYRGYLKNLYCGRTCQSKAFKVRKRHTMLNATSPS